MNNYGSSRIILMRAIQANVTRQTPAVLFRAMTAHHCYPLWYVDDGAMMGSPIAAVA